MDVGSFITAIAFTTGYVLLAISFAYKEKKSGRTVYYLKDAFVIGSLTGIVSIMLAGPEFDISL